MSSIRAHSHLSTTNVSLSHSFIFSTTRTISPTSPAFSISFRPSLRIINCVAKPREPEEQKVVVRNNNDDSYDHEEGRVEENNVSVRTSTSDSLSLGIREPVYEVVEVKSDGMISLGKQTGGIC